MKDGAWLNERDRLAEKVHKDKPRVCPLTFECESYKFWKKELLDNLFNYTEDKVVNWHGVCPEVHADLASYSDRVFGVAHYMNCDEFSSQDYKNKIAKCNCKNSIEESEKEIKKI